MAETDHSERALDEAGTQAAGVADPASAEPAGPQLAGAEPGSQRRPVRPWAAALVLAGLLIAAGAVGYALNEILDRPKPRRSAQASAPDTRSPEEPGPPSVSEADRLRDAGTFDLALAEYDRVLEVDPYDIAALYGRGAALVGLGRSAEAEDALWAVLAEDDGHVLAAEALGQHYLSKKQYWSLVKAVRPAVNAHPMEAGLQALMGRAYEQLGYTDWAVARYRLALDAVPDNPEALEGLKRLGASR